MTENTRSVVPREWHRVRVRWSDVLPSPAPSAVTFSRVDGRRWLALATSAQAPSEADGGEWISFTLRSVHPGIDRIVPTDATFLLIVRVIAPDDDRGEFRRWLDEEHSRLQVTLSGVNWYLGYEEDGVDHSFLNVWSIDQPEIVDGEAWERVRATPWWARIGHVSAGSDRGVYRREPDGRP